MDLSNLEKVLTGEPKYRLKQANEAVFKNFISDWAEAHFFTKNLRYYRSAATGSLGFESL